MKQFNRYFFLFIFLFSSCLLKAQFDNEKYDKESFLIGTLNEYMNYQRTFTNGDSFYYQRVDIMGQDELKNALFIDSLFSSDYPDITIVNNGASLGIKIYSPTLSSKIDNYYNYKPSIMMTMQHDTIYGGSVKKEMFKTEKQKLSFLLGVYLRYGRNKDMTNSRIQFFKKDNYLSKDKKLENVSVGLSMANAPSKAQACVEILKDLGCIDVEYVVLKGVPVGHHVIFIPSDKIQKVIDDAECLGKCIETIDTNHVIFTPNGTKFIWVEPAKPPFQKKGTDGSDSVVVKIKSNTDN